MNYARHGLDASSLEEEWHEEEQAQKAKRREERQLEKIRKQEERTMRQQEEEEIKKQEEEEQERKRIEDEERQKLEEEERLVNSMKLFLSINLSLFFVIVFFVVLYCREEKRMSN